MDRAAEESSRVSKGFDRGLVRIAVLCSVFSCRALRLPPVVMTVSPFGQPPIRRHSSGNEVKAYIFNEWKYGARLLGGDSDRSRQPTHDGRRVTGLGRTGGGLLIRKGAETVGCPSGPKDD